MTNLIELIKATEAISSGIQMTNEELVAEIQHLADSSEEADQKLLTTLQHPFSFVLVFYLFGKGYEQVFS